MLEAVERQASAARVNAWLAVAFELLPECDLESLT
jgi:hypothetical protein